MSAQAKTAEVRISDLDSDTVELLLRYCYGCLQELPSDHSQVPWLIVTSCFLVTVVPCCWASHDFSSCWSAETTGVSRRHL